MRNTSPLGHSVRPSGDAGPESIAVKQYHVFKMGAGKTLKSILISVGVRLSAFNLPQIARLTYTDDLHLEEMGEREGGPVLLHPGQR